MTVYHSNSNREISQVTGTAMRSKGLMLLVLALLTGCTSSGVLEAPDFYRLEQNHRSLGILPIKVYISPEKQGAKTTQQDLDQRAATYREAFQGYLYSGLKTGAEEDKYSVTFQDIEITNAILEKHLGVKPTFDLLAHMTMAEICDLLGVDALVTGSLTLTRAMGNTAAIASILLTGLGGNTNEGTFSLSIYEGQNNRLIWTYELDGTGSVLSSEESVSKKMIDLVIRKFPYRKKDST